MPGIFESIGNFFTGSPEKHKRVSTLLKNQQPVQNQLVNAAQQRGAGGAYGNAADYYYNNLSDNPQDFQAFAAPEMRRFNEEIIPGLSEQFAGMGSGGLSSSGFRNAAVNAGTDLSERLAQLRANLRSQSAQGLMNLGNQSLGNYSQDVMTRPGSEGFLSQAAPLVGAGAGFLFGGPVGASMGYQAGNMFKNSFGENKVGRNSFYYGNQQQSGY